MLLGRLRKRKRSALSLRIDWDLPIPRANFMLLLRKLVRLLRLLLLKDHQMRESGRQLCRVTIQFQFKL